MFSVVKIAGAIDDKTNLFGSELTIFVTMLSSFPLVLLARIRINNWGLFAANSKSSLAVSALRRLQNFFDGPD